MRIFTRILLAGTSPLALAVLSSTAWAGCGSPGNQSGTVWNGQGTCTIATGGGDLTQTVNPADPQGTAAQMLFTGWGQGAGSPLSITIGAGSGIVQDTDIPNAPRSAIVSIVGAGDMVSGISEINNSGTIAVKGGSSAGMYFNQNIDLTINNGTTAAGNGATISHDSDDAIRLNGHGNPEDEDPSLENPNNGATSTNHNRANLTVNNGSANSSGYILSTSDTISTGNLSGNITINNTQGEIRGWSALLLNTRGDIRITNGDGIRAGILTGDPQGMNAPASAIVIGDSYDEGDGDVLELLTPRSLTITNNSNSTIRTVDGNGAAILIRTTLAADENILTNNGTITAHGTGAAVDASYRTSGGELHVINNGTITGDIRLGRVADGDDLVFLNKGSLLNGSVIAPRAGDGNVNIGASGSGTVRLNGELGSAGTPLHQINIVNGTTLELAGNSELHYNWLNVSGDTVYDFKTHRMGITYYSTGQGPTDTINGTIAFKTTIDANAGKHGYIVFTDGNNPGVLNPSETFDGLPTITPTVVGTVAKGSRYVIMQDTLGRRADVLPAVVNGGGYRWTVSQEIGAGQTDDHGVSFGTGYSNFIITADRLNAAGAAGAAGGVNGAGMQAIVGYAGSDPALQALSQAVNNLTDEGDIRRAGAQLRPETTGNTLQASLGAVSQALSTVQVRSDAVRVAAATAGETGMASGETLKGLGVWGQGFGSTATQQERKAVSGYDADTYGLAFGVDARVADPVRAGVSFAYARTGVDSTGDRTGSGQDIDSYITSLYGTYTGKRWYVDGALTYGVHSYDSTRQVAIAGAAAQTLTADYTGQQWGARAEAGMPLTFGSVVVTPLASLAYNTLKQDGYTETGGAAALGVGSSSTDSIRSGLGGKVSARVATVGNWEVIPNARAVWNHEFNGSAPDQTSTFVAGGASFTTPGTDIAADHLTLGLGVDVASVRNTTLSAKYDADIADRYLSHTASLQLRTEF